MLSTVDVSIHEGVATVCLNRPERLNAFNREMFLELLEIFDETDSNDSVRVVIVTGAGRGFCAGADLAGGGKTFGRRENEGSSAPRDSAGELVMRIFRSIKPVIAAINGPAVGVGATMTLPMDIRLLARDAKVGFPFAARGIVPDGAASWFLPRVVGINRALEWCLSARVFSAEEALAGGLVRSLHPTDEIMTVATELAREIAANTAPVSAAITRQLMWQMLGVDHPMGAHQVESRALFDTGRMPDAVEGISAFLEKRPADWSMTPGKDLPGWMPWRIEPAYSSLESND